ncbi:acid protease [Mycena belliarum]|uniref:Acid protease n=1 Tax=Mycena belliarum TaxID=1033014 RepID=A0AAD6TWE8_9AGAR|nr:acid protease [Mycena belliae]
MSQPAAHQVPFRTVIVNAREIKQRDSARAEHFLAGHHPHGPAAFRNCNAMKGRKHHHSGGSSSAPGGSSSPPDPTTTVNVTDAAVTYLATLAVGSPATNYDLLIDTGSSNTWISAVDKRYNATSTSKDTRKKFQISYGSGSCSGTEYTDQVALGPKLVIKDQAIGVADQAADMNGMDGILGIGPVDLTQGTMADSQGGIPTVTDNLLKQHCIPTEAIGIFYQPTTTADASGGSLSFGGPDHTKYTGEINYVPITKQSPASHYWGIEQSISYGDKEIMAMASGIADTGTTLLMVPTEVFKAYQKETGAVLDQSTNLLTVTEEQYKMMKSMFFNIGGVKYELTKNAQLFPRSMNETIGAPNGKICLIFADMGNINVGDGLCFINGYTFLQRFYSVYDVSNERVGFATTEFTMATTN